MSELISVIIPVYNAAVFFDASIESVLKQIYKNVELILVNDGSTDESVKICQKYALTDKRIKTINQQNKGPAAARNNGIHHATGSLVFFLDADDLIDQNTLETMMAEYNVHNQPDMVLCNFRKINTTGEVIIQPDNFIADPREYVRSFLKYPSNHLVSYCWARLYKLSIIRKNQIEANEKMQLFEDYCFNLQYLKHTEEVVFVQKPLYVYRMHASPMSASMKHIDSVRLIHDMHMFKRHTNDFMKVKPEEIEHALIHYAIIFMIRSCRLKSDRLYTEINKLINDDLFVACLSSYKPKKGNSKILPILVKLRLTKLVILYSRHKSYKRYGRPGRK